LLSFIATVWKALTSPFFSRASMSLSSAAAFLRASAFSFASLAGSRMWKTRARSATKSSMCES
jgi:hypothetical protein